MSSNHCCSNHGCSTVCQSFSEMDFERGIWSAALNGDLERVKMFIKRGTDPNVRDNYNYTALHYAGRNGYLQVCSSLLKSGANPNCQTSGGVTPLIRASYSGHTSVVKLLLDHNADPCLCDSDGSSPLHKAVQQNNVEIIELLTRHNDKVKLLRDNKNKLAMDYKNNDDDTT
ncbi:ANKRD39 (predicted) [Pycnogonum litorale]